MRAVTLITGAGSGIGRATAELLSASLHFLVLVGRREKRLHQTAAMLHPGHVGCLVLPADVGIPEQAYAVVDRTIAELGYLNNLVNNAGIAPMMSIQDHTPRVLDEIYRVNTLGPANLIARAWPAMVRQRGGCIVNISTIGVLDPFPGFFGYAASKGALETMAKSCAKEGAAHKIRAFSIAPGAVETEMLREVYRRSGMSPRPGMHPSKVAELVEACVEGRCDDRNGQVIALDDGA